MRRITGVATSKDSARACRPIQRTQGVRRGQRGSSLIESVVASALMGIGVVAGLTAWDTASLSAGKAIRLAWANCIVRAQLDAVLSAPYEDNYDVPDTFGTDGTVEVDVKQLVRGTVAGSPGEEQLVTVEARDPREKSVVLAKASALKARALRGGKPYDGGVVSDVMLGCPAR
jgi:hypothetical protein